MGSRRVAPSCEATGAPRGTSHPHGEGEGGGNFADGQLHPWVATRERYEDPVASS